MNPWKFKIFTFFIFFIFLFSTFITHSQMLSSQSQSKSIILLLLIMLFPYIVSASLLVPISTTLSHHHKSVKLHFQNQKKMFHIEKFSPFSALILKPTKINALLSLIIAVASVDSFSSFIIVLLYGGHLLSLLWYIDAANSMYVLNINMHVHV